MTLESGVSIGQLLLAILVLLASGGTAWGALLQRVKTLEKEVEALSGFAVKLATMEADIGHIKTGITQITGSWLFREPPLYDEIKRQPAPRKRP
ncbi:MAG: hypothetical protein Q8N10_03260 [Phenylobacterium sp.]|uniref:hypothetical protein n=1 Tax=Phenylobacterium sp. TaxID=1871053 RepID=UPI002720656E|nr:hypothetical protein [Phenylobacterium sp.]MDO8912288.1 hypothetical protein [Phenylobacterium sp.]MDP3099500.1 hypothetical protein [Phenylobacterium sp.]